MHICYAKQISKYTTPTVQNCVCSNALFYLKNNIFAFFSTKILAGKIDEAIKTIFYLTHYESLLKLANLKTEYSHFLKLCLLRRTVLYKKQNFRVFESSNIGNENKRVNKNHFLFSTLCINVEGSKFQN